MHTRHIVLAVLATAVTLTSVASAGPDAAKQRVGTVKPFVRGTQWQSVDGIRFSFKVPRAAPAVPRSVALGERSG